MNNDDLKREVKENIDNAFVTNASSSIENKVQANRIQKKISSELQAQHYANDRYDRISDNEFYETRGLEKPSSLVKGEELAKQKAELEKLKKSIEERTNDLQCGMHR